MSKNINLSNIPVVIFCGGKGMRIKEFEPFLPKPLIKIGRLAIVEHVMNIYKKYGSKKFIICVGFKFIEFKKYFIKRNFQQVKKNLFIKKDLEVIIANTGLNNETGSRLKQIYKYINFKNFFLTYGDGIGNINIKSLYNFFLKNKNILTITGVDAPSRFGLIEVKDNIVKKFSEKPVKSKNLINGGFFVCSKEIFKYLNNKNSLNFEKDILSKIYKIKKVFCYKHHNFWLPMDTRRDYEKLCKIYKINKFKF